MSTTPRTRRRQGGFSIIELMVGVTLGLMLVAGLALLFANSSQSSAEHEKSLRQIENGRYAVDLLTEDLSVAGYFGEAVAEGLAATVSPCSASAAVAADLEAKRAATPATLPFGVQGLTPEEAAALGCLDHHLAGTPAIVVRRLATAAVPVASMEAGHVYLQASNNPADLNATYLAATDAASLVLKDMDGTVNKVRRYVSRVYYVSSCSDCAVDTIPTLKRLELQGGGVVAAPLAEGIERIGFDYGFDTDANGVPDSWIGLNGAGASAAATAAAAKGWENAVAVRVYLVARTTEPSPAFNDARTYEIGLDGDATPVVAGPFNDAFKRRAYVTTARLNSIAGLRE
ncbi:PilW family protein [Ramlibacter sp. USB13]|uniref:PilW family protein n=1 Tax=Ramlibacter cellulosilyticus TaxID=2764187 RepID=A0A923S9G5_9BURK|nr:PilW family protein [Ramlibacter cellulosilyticus]MBC5781661.1 PilW family protein [Ramlibacter cellulosilyticus]